MSFELLRQLQHKAVAVDRMCRVLQVSRSGYYAARKRSQSQPAVCEASVQLKAAFAASGDVYGSRRLRTAVASRGFVMGVYRQRRLIRQHGLRSTWRRKFVHTTDSRHALPISPNVFRKLLVLYEKLDHSLLALSRLAAYIMAFRKIKMDTNIIYG